MLLSRAYSAVSSVLLVSFSFVIVEFCWTSGLDGGRERRGWFDADLMRRFAVVVETVTVALCQHHTQHLCIV